VVCRHGDPRLCVPLTRCTAVEIATMDAAGAPTAAAAAASRGEPPASLPRKRPASAGKGAGRAARAAEAGATPRANAVGATGTGGTTAGEGEPPPPVGALSGMAGPAPDEDVGAAPPAADPEGTEGDEDDLNDDELADDALFNIDKMATVLADGSDDEKTVVLFEMAQLLDHCLADTLATLVPAICGLVATWPIHVRASAAEALLDVAHQPELPHATAKLIAQTALDAIDPGKTGPERCSVDAVSAQPSASQSGCVDGAQENSSGEVLNLWAEILSAVLRQVKWDRDELQAVTGLIDYHASNHRDGSRKLAARVLGSLATAIDSGQDVEQYVLPTALTLCDDVAVEVRGMVSESLALVAGRVSLRTLEQVVWPRAVSLLADPDARVHAATLRTVAHVAVQHAEPYTPPPSRAATAAAAAAAAATVDDEDLSGVFTPRRRSSAGPDLSIKASTSDPEAAAAANAPVPPGRRASTLTREERQSRTRLLRELLTPIVAHESAFAFKAASEDQRFVDDYTYLLLEIVAEVFGPLVWAVLRGDGQPKRVSSKPPGGSSHSSADLSSSILPVRTSAEILGAASKTPTEPAGAVPVTIEAETVRAFRAMAGCNGPIVRRHCAFNLPGVAASVQGQHLLDLSVVVESLSRDKDPETRWNLAAGLHEIAFLVAASGSKPAVDSLVKAAVALLQDEHALVRMNALEHFSELLPSLVQGEQGVFVARRLAPLFANLRLLAEGNWRTQRLLSKQVAASAYLMPAETLRVSVLPLLYRMAEESTYLVRMSVMGAVATCMWHIAEPEERAVVMDAFVAEWARAGLHWMRLAFVEAAAASASLFSRVLFRDVFASATLRLASDPVPNVRLRLVRALPALGRACAQMDELHRALDVLHEDPDPDVRVAVREVAPALEACLRHSISADADDERREDQELSRRELVLSSSVNSGRLDPISSSGKRHKKLLKKGAVSFIKTVRTSLHVTEEAVSIRRPAGLRLGISHGTTPPPSSTVASPTAAVAAVAAASGPFAASPRAASPSSTSSASPAHGGALSPLTSFGSSSSRDSVPSSPRSPPGLAAVGGGSGGCDWMDELSESTDSTDSSSMASSPMRRIPLIGKVMRGSPSGASGSFGTSAPGAASSQVISPVTPAGPTGTQAPAAAVKQPSAVAVVTPKLGPHPDAVGVPLAAQQNVGSLVSLPRTSPPDVLSSGTCPPTSAATSSSASSSASIKAALVHRPTLKDLKDLKARVNRKLAKK